MRSLRSRTLGFIFSAFALASAPTLVTAMCLDSKSDTASSCAEGMVFAPETATCVSQTTS